MKCTCFDTGGDYDYPIFQHSKVVKAIKPLKCDECKDIIANGDEFEIVVGKWDEKYGYDKYYTCKNCMSISEHLFCSYAYQTMLDELYGHLSYDDIPWSKISKLTPKARERVCEMIEEIWENNEE